MSENVIQTSFAAGELSPSLFARVDFAKYHSGAATMRNFFVDYRSGASTRTGTEYIRPVIGADPTKAVRLVRFQQSVDVTYVLEFGDHYLSFVTQGGSVVEPPFGIASVTKGSSTTVNSPGNNFLVNDMVFISGAVGMPQINERYFRVGTTGGGTFTLVNPFDDVSPVNSSNWGAYTGGANAQRVYRISTPYAAEDLALLKFSQKTSRMNITHPKYTPYVLTLISATNWTLNSIVISSGLTAPTGLSAVPSASGSASYNYTVTATSKQGDESDAAPQVGVTSAVDMRTTAGSVSLSWTPVAGAFAYNVYKTITSLTGSVPSNTDVGFIGTTTAPNFIDSNIAPDFAQTPPIQTFPFAANLNPGCSSYFQQRLVYANGGINDADRFWMSIPNSDYNFSVSNPSQADDSIDARLVSLEVNEIKSLIPMPSGLIALTTKGAWQISGGAGGVATQGGPVTPTTLTATPQAYIGANDVPPILVNYDIFFIQQKGSIVRNMSYNIYANIYTGNDISILSSHLFYGHTMKEWAYAEEPFKIVWVVRTDGELLSLTTLKEQDMYGWARHDTFGWFRSVCTVTEGTVDATYFVVERPNPYGAGTVKLIERFAERQFTFGAEDAWSVDCATKTTQNEPSANLTVSAATGNVTMTADSPVFGSNMVGWVVRVGGGIAKATNFISPMSMTATITKAITQLIANDPLGRPSIANAGTWSIDQPFTTFFGLDQLEGQTVPVLADGGVVNNITVTDGTITLPQPVTKVVVGYGFQAQLQTMYLDLGQEVNTVQGKRKKVAALTVRVKDSRGAKVGRTFQHLVPIKELNRVTLMGFPIDLVTSDERVIMDPLWDVPGQICVQVDDPLPVTVLGVVPEIIVGDSAK